LNRKKKILIITLLFIFIITFGFYFSGRGDVVYSCDPKPWYSLKTYKCTSGNMGF